MDGFINLNKPKNFTSHDAVNLVRKIFQIKKVGHGGTLDPAAEGVLPVAIGRATKFIEYLADCDKTYRAEIFIAEYFGGVCSISPIKFFAADFKSKAVGISKLSCLKITSPSKSPLAVSTPKKISAR